MIFLEVKPRGKWSAEKRVLEIYNMDMPHKSTENNRDNENGVNSTNRVNDA